MRLFYKHLFITPLLGIYSSILFSSDQFSNCIKQSIINSSSLNKNVEILDEIRIIIPNESIEIAAGSKPICKNCIQIDKYSNTKEMMQNYSKVENPKMQSREIEARLIVANKFDPKLSSNNFAAKTQNGIIADAYDLPFEPNSISIIISKNFEWFNNKEPEKTIRPLLEEYRRVLKEGGEVYLLKDGTNNFEAFEIHRSIAQFLGFRTKLIRLKNPNSSGILLKL